MSEAYDEQRRVGAGMIVAAAHRMAEAAGIELVCTLIDGGKEIVAREVHILALATADKCAQVEFSDESLADFPGHAETAQILAKIRRGIYELL